MKMLKSFIFSLDNECAVILIFVVISYLWIVRFLAYLYRIRKYDTVMLSVFRFHAVVFSKSIHLSPLQFYFIIFVCVCCAAAGIRQVTVMSMKASTTLACWRRCWMRAKNMYLFLTLITWELLSTSVSLHVYVCVWSVIHHHHQTTGLKSRCHSENRFGALYCGGLS